MAAQKLSDAALDKIGRIVTYVRGDSRENDDQHTSAFQRFRERNFPLSPQTTDNGAGTGSDEVDTSPPVNRGLGGATVQSVVDTIFGACIGNISMSQKSPTNTTNDGLPNSLRKNLGKKLIPKANQHRNNTTNKIGDALSQDDCHYTQSFDDDHGRTARDTLVMKHNEARKQKARKDRVEQIQKDAIEETERSHSRPQTNLSNLERLNISLDRAVYDSSKFHGSNVLIQNGHIGYKNDNRFDDEISALSAQTLEEMLTREGIFDLSRQVGEDTNSLPPIPVKTESSESEDQDNAKSLQEKEYSHSSLYTRNQNQSNQPLHQKRQQNEQRDNVAHGIGSNELKINTTEERQKSSEIFGTPQKPTSANSSGKSFHFESHPHDVYPIHKSKNKVRIMSRLNRRSRRYEEIRDSRSPTRRVQNVAEI